MFVLVNEWILNVWALHLKFLNLNGFCDIYSKVVYIRIFVCVTHNDQHLNLVLLIFNASIKLSWALFFGKSLLNWFDRFRRIQEGAKKRYDGEDKNRIKYTPHERKCEFLKIQSDSSPKKKNKKYWSLKITNGLPGPQEMLSFFHQTPNANTFFFSLCFF